MATPDPAPQQINDPYKAGARNRLWRDWEPDHRSGDDSINANWDLLVTRLRDLQRNEPTVRGLMRTLSKFVIGTGIATFSNALTLAGATDAAREPGSDEFDDEFNFESDELFEEWSEEEADVQGRLSWQQMQALHFQEVMSAGESLLLKCYDRDPNRTMPLCFQLLEPEQLDYRMNFPREVSPSGNKIVRGVEINDQGRAVAYWIFDTHPYDSYSNFNTKSTRIPADRVIHTYLPNRPSENRGATWFSTNVQIAKDTDWYVGNELTAAALGALLTLIVKRKSGAGSGIGFVGDNSSMDGASDQYGNSTVKLGRGLVADLGADDDIKVAESSRPNRDAAPFIKLLSQLQGQGSGLSLLRVTGDYSQSSYTSARGAHLDDQAFFLVLQAFCSRSFVRPVRRMHTIEAAGYGLFRSISARQFEKSRRQMLRVTVQPPGREQLDPEKETESAAARIRCGFSTWQDECGARGKNWRRVALQQRRERQFFSDTLGFVPDLANTVQGKKAETDSSPEPAPQPEAP
jgi:lambda family phage portal protein